MYTKEYQYLLFLKTFIRATAYPIRSTSDRARFLLHCGYASLSEVLACILYQICIILLCSGALLVSHCRKAYRLLLLCSCNLRTDAPRFRPLSGAVALNR